MSKYEKKFESERIYYTKITKDLIEDYLKMINDIEVANKISHNPKTFTYEDELKWVESTLRENAIIFSMIEKNTEEYIGNVEIMHINDKGIGEIGICITASKQNQHYGTEAMEAIIKYGFEKMVRDDDKYKILKEFYSTGAEDKRLKEDKAHQVEFLTTTRYINKFLKDNDKILEVGAGTGAYSIYYAKKRYQVSALELVKENIDILKSKITDDMNIKVTEGTALDLSCYEDNSFDMTLVLGPLYHLYTESDKKKAMEEAVRVTKHGGYLYIAYLTNDSVMLSYALKKHHLLDKGLFDKNYKFYDKKEEIFTTFNIEDFNELIKEYPLDYVTTVATDGLSTILRDYVNDLSDEEFKVWLDYHYKSCERKDLAGYSSHVLYIGRKK